MKSEVEFLQGILEDITNERDNFFDKIRDRITELEEALKDYKTDFSEIFNYANDEFNIEWNPANDVFFGNSLDYKSYNEYTQSDLLECCTTDPDKHSFTKSEINKMTNNDKSFAIILHFMQANNIGFIFIKND
jgi:site-specific DNA-adenine methylase